MIKKLMTVVVFSGLLGSLDTLTACCCTRRDSCVVRLGKYLGCIEKTPAEQTLAELIDRGLRLAKNHQTDYMKAIALSYDELIALYSSRDKTFAEKRAHTLFHDGVSLNEVISDFARVHDDLITDELFRQAFIRSYDDVTVFIRLVVNCIVLRNLRLFYRQDQITAQLKKLV